MAEKKKKPEDEDVDEEELELESVAEDIADRIFEHNIKKKLEFIPIPVEPIAPVSEVTEFMRQLETKKAPELRKLLTDEVYRNRLYRLVTDKLIQKIKNMPYGNIILAGGLPENKSSEGGTMSDDIRAIVRELRPIFIISEIFRAREAGYQQQQPQPQANPMTVKITDKDGNVIEMPIWAYMQNNQQSNNNELISFLKDVIQNLRDEIDKLRQAIGASYVDKEEVAAEAKKKLIEDLEYFEKLRKVFGGGGEAKPAEVQLKELDVELEKEKIAKEHEREMRKLEIEETKAEALKKLTEVLTEAASEPTSPYPEVESDVRDLAKQKLEQVLETTRRAG